MKIDKLVESVYRIRDTEGRMKNYELTPVHREMLLTGLIGDRSALYRVVNKGRQGGYSVFGAVEHLTIAQMLPNTYIYYVATMEGQAESWLRKVNNMSKNQRVMPNGQKLIYLEEKASKTLCKAIRHYPRAVQKGIKKAFDWEESYITGLSASPSGIRGESAIAIVVDEYAQMTRLQNQQQEVYAAIGYFIAGGGQLTIQSTPLVRSDKFWDFYVNNEAYGMKKFYGPIIENWEELELNYPLFLKLDDQEQMEFYVGHKDYYPLIRDNVLINKKRYNNVAIQPMKIPYYWYDLGFLEQKRSEDIDIFKQEVLGIPLDRLYKYIIQELLLPQITSKIVPFPEMRAYEVGMGIDVAQVKDTTAITSGTNELGTIYERDIFETQDNYPEQFKQIKEKCKIIKPNWICIDNTGVGIALADMIEDHPGMPNLIRVDFRSMVELETAKVKMPEHLAMEFKKSLNLARYKLLKNDIAIKQVLNLEKIVTDTTIKYTGKRGGKRDDHFFSKALLNYGFFGKINKMGVPFTVPIDSEERGVSFVRKGLEVSRPFAEVEDDGFLMV